MDFVSNILIQGRFKSKKTRFVRSFPLEDGRLTTPFILYQTDRLAGFGRCSCAGSHGAFQQMMATRHGDSHVFGCPKNTRNAEIFSGEVESNKTHLGQHTTFARLEPYPFFWQVGCDKNENAHLSTGKHDLKMKRP